MPKPGPPKKPTRLRVLAGNPSGRPLERNVPVGPSGPPPCPRELTPEARREWRRTVKVLSLMGTVTKADRAALAAYCEAWSTWCEAQRHLREEGYIVLTPNGYPQQSPWVSIANKAFRQMYVLIQDFGLTPLARSKLEMPERDSGASDFLSFG